MHHEQWLQNSCNSVFSRDMICFRYISVNTLHKDDDDDDDDNNSNNNNNKSRHITLLLPKLDIYLVCSTMPTTFPPRPPTSTHQAYTKEPEVGGALPHHPSPSHFSLTHLVQKRTILRCNWQQRTWKNESKKKLATKKVSGTSCYNKAQSSGEAVRMHDMPDILKESSKFSRWSFSATELVHMNSSRRHIPIGFISNLHLFLSCRQITQDTPDVPLLLHPDIRIL
jgi:hypothetical protein